MLVEGTFLVVSMCVNPELMAKSSLLLKSGLVKDDFPYKCCKKKRKEDLCDKKRGTVFGLFPVSLICYCFLFCDRFAAAAAIEGVFRGDTVGTGLRQCKRIAF